VKVGVPVIEEEVDFPFFEEEIEEGKFVPWVRWYMLSMGFLSN
jgi:hypothetical protein